MSGISPDLAQKTGGFIKGKLLCYFRYSALVTYFSTLPSASISMPCILSLYKIQKEMLKKRVLQHLLIFGAQCLKTYVSLQH